MFWNRCLGLSAPAFRPVFPRLRSSFDPFLSLLGIQSGLLACTLHRAAAVVHTLVYRQSAPIECMYNPLGEHWNSGNGQMLFFSAATQRPLEFGDKYKSLTCLPKLSQGVLEPRTAIGVRIVVAHVDRRNLNSWTTTLSLFALHSRWLHWQALPNSLCRPRAVRSLSSTISTCKV